MASKSSQNTCDELLNEEEFILKQAKLRSVLRIQNGRAKPIDLLSQYLETDHSCLFMLNIKDPVDYIRSFKIVDLQTLLSDIKLYQDLEKNENLDFWNDLQLVVENIINEKRSGKLESLKIAKRTPINSSVKGDIDIIFKNKTLEELKVLYFEVENKIASHHMIDIAYWEVLRDSLKIQIAEEKLRDVNKKLMNSVEKISVSTELEGKVTNSGDRENRCESIDERKEIYLSEQYSPKLTPYNEIPNCITVVDAVDDMDQLLTQQQLVKRFYNFACNPKSESHKTFCDKYKPCKPRYFNRVHTGYDWNMYNKTHYDLNNPPPKIVQGYKFNIFYPHLIYKNKIPEYTVLPCDNNDFATLKFHAGPPYEDIAFKIVNQEWDYSRKRGFKCQFTNDVFQLWFHFKKQRYRR